MNEASNPQVIREVDATPYASALIEGHRDFGYSLETALSDVIDNSISARATYVNLIAETYSEEPWIALIDDGTGMSEAELVEAMRLGSKNPTEKRDLKDLGRFGLGLKSASFSQCRRLTVLTRRQDVTSCACWDLDRVAEQNSWALQMIDDVTHLTFRNLLPQTGTVVIWQKLDRLSGGYVHNRAKRAEHLNAEFARAERHLRIVFHRFMEGSKPRLRVSLNRRILTPIDPMASSHPATQKAPEEPLRLKKGEVLIQCYTLPHHNKMSRDAWEEIGGPEGHLKSQGLYIYRGDRLIIAGGWLGLARQTELTKLCRIAIDIPNSMDSDWMIDVKKASAQLPPVVRDRLKRVVERFIGTSKRTYRNRGQRLVDETQLPIWNRIKKDGQIIFRPNLEHPAFSAYQKCLPQDLQEGFQRCLRLLGSGLPIEALHAELVGNPEAVIPDSTNDADLEQMVHAMTDTLIANGVTLKALPDVMQSHPFLRANWQSAKTILENFLKGRFE
tara:strand:- start:4568 stop:6070 length:1503 start_codon:yes stop_codon:yes gene_type:complete